MTIDPPEFDPEWKTMLAMLLIQCAMHQKLNTEKTANTKQLSVGYGSPNLLL